MSRNHSARRGAVIIAALVCLLIVVALVGAMLQSALRARQQLARHRDLRQTELLLAAGIERAQQRLSMDASYRGETWSLPADSTARLAAGEVRISFSQPAAEASGQFTIVAEYPLGDEHSIRRSRTIEVSSPSTQP